MAEPFRTLYWQDQALYLLDQTALPGQEIYREYRSASAAADAIRHMIVRGAPAIGITAAYAVALAAREVNTSGTEKFRQDMQAHFKNLASTRPTAVNLFWALERMQCLLNLELENNPFRADEIAKKLLQEALKIHRQDIENNRQMGAFGQELFPNPAKILTHCNAGALATGGYGTALGVIYAAKERGKSLQVFADETRPFLQGSRLTAWELQKNGVPVTLICDNMAGYIMKTVGMDLVIVGADRIARNGDVANKIGTYSLAILSREHKVPFYVAAPLSTIDLSIPSGSEIPIEERNPDEVTKVAKLAVAPQGISVRNPAFDTTPHHLITAIITEKGIARPPYLESLKELYAKS